MPALMVRVVVTAVVVVMAVVAGRIRPEATTAHPRVVNTVTDIQSRLYTGKVLEIRFGEPRPVRWRPFPHPTTPTLPTTPPTTPPTTSPPTTPEPTTSTQIPTTTHSPPLPTTTTPTTSPTTPPPQFVQEPVVMPVTEGKNQPPYDPVLHYGLPKELLPIHPGGGSRFEDLEREKLERAKMSQTKLKEGEDENGNSYDAEGLYSSASELHPTYTLLISVVATFSRLALHLLH